MTICDLCKKEITGMFEEQRIVAYEKNTFSVVVIVDTFINERRSNPNAKDVCDSCKWKIAEIAVEQKPK